MVEEAEAKEREGEGKELKLAEESPPPAPAPRPGNVVGLVEYDPDEDIPLPYSFGEPIGIAADDEPPEEEALLDELDQLPPSSSKPSSFNGKRGKGRGGASFPSGEDPHCEEKILLREVDAGRGRSMEGGGGGGWDDEEGEEAGWSIVGVRGRGGD